jgi:hypothetical protein
MGDRPQEPAPARAPPLSRAIGRLSSRSTPHARSRPCHRSPCRAPTDKRQGHGPLPPAEGREIGDKPRPDGVNMHSETMVAELLSGMSKGRVGAHNPPRPSWPNSLASSLREARPPAMPGRPPAMPGVTKAKGSPRARPVTYDSIGSPLRRRRVSANPRLGASR